MAVRRRKLGPAGEEARKAHAWLELLQTSGPFLTLPVVSRVFRAGLPAVPTADRARVRGLVSSMLDAGGASREATIEAVLRDLLSWGDQLLTGADVPATLAESVLEHGQTVRPDFAFLAPDDASDSLPDPEGDAEDDAEEPATDQPYRLLGMISPWGSHPLARTTVAGWTASPAERLAVLLRARDVPIGLVTDGRWWGLVWAPRGGTTGVAVWDAGLFSEESDSLRAFVALLHRRAFLNVGPGDTLPELLLESLQAAEEVTETLGRQVREAVELLVLTLDRLDADSGGDLLRGVDDDELYAGCVMMLMRIVFLLFAEDRRLLPSDDHLYLSGYSISTLVESLERQARLAGEQTLEHRTTGWHRVLATTRALHGGVAHEDLRLPAYGGHLFDPEQYLWLEAAERVDDRTVLRMLRAVQFVHIGGERRRLTFRALDVEQIGYVYEGLLELEVRTASEVTLCLARPKDWPRGKEPTEITISQAAEWLNEAPLRLAERLKARLGRAESAIEKVMLRMLEAHERDAVLRATGGDAGLAAAILPLAPVLHWVEGAPAIIGQGRRFVAPSTRRAATGTHYTPRQLAEEVVVGALEPLVFRPGPLETADRSQWRRRPSPDLERLRVADIAMGSGAFLVAACRYLADQLVEAWREAGRDDAVRAHEAGLGRGAGRLDADAEVADVVLAARRVIAERCLYGVDINPLAVEMAKLSLWLITMDARRPFGYLDDRLVAGDSLLGVVDPEQLEELHLEPRPAGAQASSLTLELDYSGRWRSRLLEAADLRRQITATPVVTPRHVEHKQRLLTRARESTRVVSVVADALTGVGLTAAAVRNAKQVAAEFAGLRMRVGHVEDGDESALEALRRSAWAHLQRGLPEGKEPRHPLHWPVAFPEVLVDPIDPGFDAIIGNPPFLGGQKLSGTLGDDYLAWLQRWDGRGVRGSADLAARFVLRANRLLNSRGQLGFITTKTLVQGDTLQVGLEQTSARGLAIRAGRSSHAWPTKSANLEIVNVWATRARLGRDASYWLDGEDVPMIGPDLEPVGRVRGRPFRLAENGGLAFQGSNVLGLGFTMPPAKAAALIARDPRNTEALQPYVIGKDLNQRPDQSASRWVINFQDWSLEKAERYSDLIEVVRRLVKPKRDGNKRTQRRERWWIYAERAPELYVAIADLDHVLVMAQVSSTLMPVRVDSGHVYSHKVVVFAEADAAFLAVLSSSAHQVWTQRYTSTMRRDLSYSPSDVFLTLPRPEVTSELANLGEQLDTERRELMLSRAWGLTTAYNAVHNPAVRDPGILRLRELHEAIDYAVLAAYGWDLDPQIGHHPTKIGTRWTVSREARFELLDLLLKENHRRHAAEQAGN